MKLLVIGKTGQLAQSLSEVAEDAGLDLTTIGRPEIDLAEPRSIDKALSAHTPDIIINAAAYTQVDKAEEEPELARAINTDAPGAIAAHCSRRDIPFIHISTDYVFDGDKNEPYSESDPTAPGSVYGETKRDGERRVIEFCHKHIVLRTAWLFSPFGKNFVKTMLRLAESRPEIKVVDDQVGCPTYAPHLATVILTLAEHLVETNGDEIAWGIYNAAAGGQASWFDLARETFAQSAICNYPSAVVCPIPSSEYPTPAARPANSRLDCTRLRENFGLSLPDWQIGLRQCVARLSAEKIEN